MIIINKQIVKYLTFNFANGITIYPFIFLAVKNIVNENHEKIHLCQQKEMLIIPFFVLYIIYFILNLFWYRNFRKAYRNIPFEKEAFDNELNLDYLKTRKFLNT